MVQYDQGAVGGPQWPPKQDQSRWAQHGFMAKCARSGSGRPVEWPPRPEGVYGSQPTLLSSGEQVPPPVPPRPSCYPLRKDHSSAPNLLDEPPQRPPKLQWQPAPSAPPLAAAEVQETEAPTTEVIREPVEAVLQQPQEMSSETSSNTSKQQTGEEPNLTTVYPSNFKLRSEMPVEQQRAPVITSQPAFKSTKPIKMRGDSKWPPAAGQDNSQQEVREFIKPKKQCKDYTSFFAQNALSPNYTGYRAPPGTQHVGAVEEDASDM